MATITQTMVIECADQTEFASMVAQVDAYHASGTGTQIATRVDDSVALTVSIEFDQIES